MAEVLMEMVFFVILMHFNVSMKYGESIKSWKLQFSSTWRIFTFFYAKYQVWGKY